MVSKKILFLLKVPPPVHGSTMMNKIVMESETLRKHFDCSYFPLSVSKDLRDVGKFSISKASNVIGSYFKLRTVLRTERPNLVYFALSPTGIAFVKDFFFT